MKKEPFRIQLLQVPCLPLVSEPVESPSSGPSLIRRAQRVELFLILSAYQCSPICNPVGLTRVFELNQIRDPFPCRSFRDTFIQLLQECCLRLPEAILANCGPFCLRLCLLVFTYVSLLLLVVVLIELINRLLCAVFHLIPLCPIRFIATLDFFRLFSPPGFDGFRILLGWKDIGECRRREDGLS